MYYSELTIYSSFQYGIHHFQEGKNLLLEKKDLLSKIKGIAEIIFGLLEFIPFVGLGLAWSERRISRRTVEGICQARENYVKEFALSDSQTLQSLFFDTYSSREMISQPRISVSSLFSLGNSLPDLQFLHLRRDLEFFMNQKELKPREKEKLMHILQKLERGQKLASLISCIILESSLKTKEALQKSLAQEIETQFHALQDGDYMILPCGHMKGNVCDLEGFTSQRVSGHSNLVKIEKIAGCYHLKIFDTASTPTLKKESLDPDKLYPARIDKIPKEKFSSEFFDRLTRLSIDSSVEDLDTFFTILGPFNMIDPNDKPYHKQNLGIHSVSNCTKKCLQVWMHEELKDDPALYQSFRILRGEKLIADAQAFSKKLKGHKYVSYTHPLLKWGYAKESSLLRRIFQTLRGFFIGHSLNISIKRKDIKLLINNAENVNSRRKKKLKTLLQKPIINQKIEKKNPFLHQFVTNLMNSIDTNKIAELLKGL